MGCQHRALLLLLLLQVFVSQPVQPVNKKTSAFPLSPFPPGICFHLPSPPVPSLGWVLSSCPPTLLMFAPHPHVCGSRGWRWSCWLPGLLWHTELMTPPQVPRWWQSPAALWCWEDWDPTVPGCRSVLLWVSPYSGLLISPNSLSQQSGGVSIPPMKMVNPASRLKQSQQGSPDKSKHIKQRMEYMRIQGQQQVAYL